MPSDSRISLDELTGNLADEVLLMFADFLNQMADTIRDRVAPDPLYKVMKTPASNLKLKPSISFIRLTALCFAAYDKFRDGIDFKAEAPDRRKIADIITIGEIAALSEDDVLTTHFCSHRILQILKEILAQYNLSVGDPRAVKYAEVLRAKLIATRNITS